MSDKSHYLPACGFHTFNAHLDTLLSSGKKDIKHNKLYCFSSLSQPFLCKACANACKRKFIL